MSEMVVEFKRRLFTVEEYHRLFDGGVLCDRDGIELIDGELIVVPPIGQLHRSRHARITRYLTYALEGRATVFPMGSFPLGDISEPQPDLAVFPFDSEMFERRPNPPISEFVAFLEIADSSLAYDSNTKMRLYASHGVSDYLLVDVRGNLLHHYGGPTPDGYLSHEILTYGETFALSKIPDVALAAGEFLALR